MLLIPKSTSISQLNIININNQKVTCHTPKHIQTQKSLQL